MFKCKEVLPKYNPSKLFTLAHIVCINNEIDLCDIKHIEYQLPNNPIQVIYSKYCLKSNCHSNKIHDHIETSIQDRFICPSPHSSVSKLYPYKYFFARSLVEAVIPFNEFSSETVNEHKRRACKRRLDF